MLKTIRIAALSLTALALAAGSALATDYTVEMKNKGDSGVMVFEPLLTEIQVGDTVTFVASDKSHNAESIDGLIPDGATPFAGELSKDVTVTFDVPGVYAVKCKPHFTMGMVALIVVGDNVDNLAAIEEAKWPKTATKRLKPVFETLDAK